jgi:hypothetical protein
LRKPPDYTTRHWFRDATLDELAEILELLPGLETRKLDTLLLWVNGEIFYASLLYDTGTRWLIHYLKGTTHYGTVAEN